jgi:RNA exonuclease 1
MANLNYPLPGFEKDEIVGILPVIPTKEEYASVTKDSPIYVLDCEMCNTEVGMAELTRVTLVSSLLKEEIISE